MQATTSNESDHVRANTSPESLKNIDRTMEEKVAYYSTQPREVISRRIRELEQEWDIERVLEAQAAGIALFGLCLGITKSRKYLVLTASVLGFLMTHAIRGWCPPVPALRAIGVRTRSEIDREKFALKVLRGDFQEVANVGEKLKNNPVTNVISAVKET